jgi:hypothetical protein
LGQIWQASTFATLLDRFPREYSDIIPYSLLKEALTLFLNDPLTAHP